MADSEELMSLDALAQAELVRKREVQAVELVNAAIECIERVNSQLNAVITPMYDRMWQFIPYTPVCNATGQPAMSVPLFWNDNDLPIGTHFVGRFGDEATLFRLAGQLEEARPWADRRPPVSVHAKEEG